MHLLLPHSCNKSFVDGQIQTHVSKHKDWNANILKYPITGPNILAIVVDDSLVTFWSRYRPNSSVDKPEAVIQWCSFSVNYNGVVF